MTQGVPLRLTLVWFVLVSATAFSWIVGGNAVAGTMGASLAPVAILVVAMLKARLVIIHFMDIASAPILLRVACEAWVILVGAVMVAMFLFG